MSRAHSRRQIDVNKILIKVESSDEFYNKENEEGENVMGEKIGIGEIKKKATSTVEVVVDPNAMAAPAPKKQEIIIPVTKQLEDPLKAMPEFDDILHKKRKMQNHFIRINYCQPQPSPDIYEPTDEDLKFLKELNEKVPKGTKSSNEITLGNFAKTFEIWENVTDKNEIITLAKAQASVETLYSGPLKEFVPKIYEYWKNLRETYQRPLLRKFWRVVNKDENNPNAAFRARENPKMKTRRARGTNEQENTDKMRLLHQDIQMATVLLGNVRYREMLKMEMFDLAVMKFESSLKEKADHSSNLKMMEKFRESYENEAYLKIRNKMKEYNGDAQKLIDDFNAGNATIEEKPPAALKPTPKPIVTPVVNASEELNFDLGSFIATIIDESLNKDISPEAIRKLIDITVPVTMPEPDKVPSDLERQPSVNLKKMASMHEPLQAVLPSPSSLELPTKMNRTNSISIPQKHQPIKADQAVKPPQIPFEDKSLLKYTIRKRIGRQKRILLERIFEDEENSLFAHHKDYYMTTSPQKEILIAPEVAQKLPTPNLRQLYINRFEKFRDICPFNDSEEEADMTESTKMIKNLGSNFKNFMKQRRPVNPIM